MYYVYEWYMVETGEVIYVGKGTKNRYKVRKHNKFFNEMIKRCECSSRIVKEFESEQDAFRYEYERIIELKNKGECVCNIYDGGFGGTTEWWTEEEKERYSRFNVMKSESQRNRMSKNNPMKNKNIAKKVNAKKRIPIMIGNTEYESIQSVCDKYCVSRSTVNGWIINGITSTGELCKYKNAEASAVRIHVNNGQNKRVIYKGMLYESSAELGRALGISQTTASRWARQGRDSHGNSCYYECDADVQNHHLLKLKSVPVIVNGIRYSSKQKASEMLGITPYTLTQYLNGNLKDEKYNCEYDNQHPSHGNTDNSTVEGSTTNG